MQPARPRPAKVGESPPPRRGGPRVKGVSRRVTRTAGLSSAKAAEPAPPAVHDRIDRELDHLVGRQIAALGDGGEDLESFQRMLGRYVLAPGKRLRPLFAYWGYRTCGGPATGDLERAAVRSTCAVELLHACALLCDDVMDDSAVRRGRPAAHVTMADRHDRGGWVGDAQRFGESSAVLMGLLAFTWADAAVVDSGLPAERVAAALRVLVRLRAEAVTGQYLDLLYAARGAPDPSAVARMYSYKSGRYTIERPLHFGHALAAGHPDDLSLLSAYARPLGTAFQLRDDVLGVFGDPEVTGKPAGEDLAMGKETPLVQQTRDLSDAAGRRLLDRCLGHGPLDDADLARIRELIAGCGALAATEARIAELAAEAGAVLDAAPRVPGAARAALRHLAVRVIDRER